MHIRPLTLRRPAPANQVSDMLDLINGALDTLAAILDTIAMIGDTLGKE
jgi:hypothetical protein